MRCYKQIDTGHIQSVGTGLGGEEITEAEYNEILAVIRAKPADTDTTGYRLKTDLTWEEYPIEPPDPDPEIEDAELLDILMGGAE